jgi:hypothetical protein
MAGRQPNPRPARDRDRHRRLPATAAITADIVAASTAPVIRSRTPDASSISITPAAADCTGAEKAGGSGTTATEAK